MIRLCDFSGAGLHFWKMLVRDCAALLPGPQGGLLGGLSAVGRDVWKCATPPRGQGTVKIGYQDAGLSTGRALGYKKDFLASRIT